MALSTLPPTRMVPSESVYGLNCLNFPFVKESLKLFWPSLIQWSSAYRNSWGERGPSLGCIFSSRRILLQILRPRFQITLFAINRMFGFNSRYTRKLDDILLFLSSVSLTTDPSSGHLSQIEGGTLVHASRLRSTFGLKYHTSSATFISPGMCLHWLGLVLVWISPTLTGPNGWNFLASQQMQGRTILLCRNKMIFSNWNLDCSWLFFCF